MDPIRIAIWSGPRNISTALMRSWDSRGDAYVTDEPLYSYYLKYTGLEHPARNEILATQNPDWRQVVDWLQGPVPGGYAIWYQKHMAHHLVGDLPLDWIESLSNCLLIRDPAEVLLSYLKKNGEVTAAALGFMQQQQLFDTIRTATGDIPPVIDARDILQAPERILTALCERLDIEFTSKMLTWEPGLRKTDGVWAPHWYDAVAKSTGWQKYSPKAEKIPEEFMPIYRECKDYYNYLYSHRIRP